MSSIIEAGEECVGQNCHGKPKINQSETQSLHLVHEATFSNSSQLNILDTNYM